MKQWLRCACLCGFVSCGLAQERYPVAAQMGPSCGFFANVPALTFATGIDVAASPHFIAPIYQLHRRDAPFTRSFSKEKFYELFAIPYTSHEIKHADLPLKSLKTLLSTQIADKFDPALARGHLFSLRVIGIFGGPHNALLMAKEGNLYVLHDPYPGVVKRMNREDLAAWMLVPTSATRHGPLKRYITQYLEITLPTRHAAPWKKLSDLPGALSLEWTAAERQVLRNAFRADEEIVADKGLDTRIRRFSDLDFAALPPEKPGESARNAILEELEAPQMKGVLHLSMMSLSLWHLRHRDRLPVVFLRGRPHVLSSYRIGGKDQEKSSTFVFDDGQQSFALSEPQALLEFKNSGSHYATITLPCRDR